MPVQRWTEQDRAGGLLSTVNSSYLQGEINWTWRIADEETNWSRVVNLNWTDYSEGEQRENSSLRGSFLSCQRQQLDMTQFWINSVKWTYKQRICDGALDTGTCEAGPVGVMRLHERQLNAPAPTRGNLIWEQNFCSVSTFFVNG